MLSQCNSNELACFGACHRDVEIEALPMSYSASGPANAMLRVQYYR